MTANMEAPFGRGQIGAAGAYDHLVGMVKQFRDLNYASTERVTPQNSGGYVTCKLMKNGSGGTLAKSVIVGCATGYEGTRAGAKTSAGDIGAGVVDEFLSTTVAANETFWMVIKGRTKLITDGSGALAQGDQLVTAGSSVGKVKKQTAAPADATAAMVQVNSRVGTCHETVAGTDGLYFAATVDFTRSAP